MRFARDDLYKILGLQDFAPIEEVRRTHKKLALIHHPDRGGDTKVMQIINAAADILIKQKEEYDSWLHQVRTPRQVAVIFRWAAYGTTYGSDNSTTSSGWS